MKFWMTSFVVLFGLAELFQWVRHFTLPLPIFILGGAFLAIASNYDKQAGLPFRFRDHADDEAIATQTPTTLDAAELDDSIYDSQSAHYPEPQLPNFKPQSTRPISFTIRKPE
jgi:hypothetical protein